MQTTPDLREENTQVADAKTTNTGEELSEI